MAAKKKAAHKTSPRSTFTAEVGEDICAGLAEGRSLLSICDAMGIAESTARQWEQDNPGHAANSTRARELGCHALASQCLEIADDDTRDWEPVTDSDGRVIGIKVDGEHVQRSKLRIETRMRLIGKWLPRVYGDRTVVAGDPEAPLNPRPLAGVSTEDLTAALAALGLKL